MISDLLTRKAEIVVKNESDSVGADYTVTVSGTARGGGNAANFSTSSSGGMTTIDGTLGPGNQDNFIVEGDVESVEGSVVVSTREVISSDWTSAVVGAVALVFLGFLARIYS
jgi:hypothetical protein